jgi:hypothetical protein
MILSGRPGRVKRNYGPDLASPRRERPSGAIPGRVRFRRDDRTNPSCLKSLVGHPFFCSGFPPGTCGNDGQDILGGTTPPTENGCALTKDDTPFVIGISFPLSFPLTIGG